MLILYSFLFTLFSPLVFLGFVWRYGLRRTLSGLPERLGWGGKWPVGPTLWVHAASVGEVRAVEPLLRALSPRFPTLTPLLTTTTVNGKELAERLALAPVVRLAPFDRPGAVHRFLRRAQPKALVLVETELWPHWLGTLAGRDIPVAVVNGRISDKAYPLYYALRRILSPLLATLARVGVQSPVQASRFLRLGAHPEAVAITGNLKFDVPLPDVSRRKTLREAYGFHADDRVWVCGSTHPGEEEGLAQVWRALRVPYPHLKLVMAPRHVERAREIRRLFETHGDKVCLRSERSSRGEEVDVLVLDTVGELAELFGAATVAFVGGSLVNRGGQNPLEAARWGVPPVWGPHMSNFREIAQQLKENGGGLDVADFFHLHKTLEDWLSHPEEAVRTGMAARAVCDGQRGALEANLSLIAEAMTVRSSQRRRKPGRCRGC